MRNHPGTHPDYALRESLFRAVSRHVGSKYRDILDRALNDYGTVSERKVHRYLRKLIAEGLLLREGSRSWYLYRRTAIALPPHPRESYQPSLAWVRRRATRKEQECMQARNRSRKLLRRSRSASAESHPHP